MKKVIFSLALLLTSSLLGYAQKGISYQAIILDPRTRHLRPALGEWGRVSEV
jgi:hypothetical protein